ncbi:PREDICTED: CICLE_v10030423mg [Prunus dulcis]|uniref:PREDICTED: CICLE_v10030423mg n=1 Tax=Prunus dulcis TaxID=3755 RepID=A0A5E4FRK9_PRUDU|nr:hypothetical protein L3X38_044033 [Prunus dulcis]VVA30129.1 PREDICTED: CICLE_v10030423mg [Prunus dulcis]
MLVLCVCGGDIYHLKGMAVLVMIYEGLSLCASTIWDLQEMRFAAIFDDVSFVAITIIMAAVSCFIAALPEACPPQIHLGVLVPNARPQVGFGLVSFFLQISV